MMDYTGILPVSDFRQIPVVSSQLGHQNTHSSAYGHQNLQCMPVPSHFGVPLQTPCHFCKDQIIRDLFNCKVPVQIKLSVPFCESLLGSTSVRNPLENELLQQTPPSNFPSHQQTSSRRDSRGSKRKSDETCKKYACAGGPSKWFVKRRTDQLTASLNSKNKMVRTQRVLKRLQNHHMRHSWRLEERRNAEERESIRQSKFKVLCEKGIKAPRQTECTLWNCPRKEYKRKRPFMPVDLTTRRSASRLSNLSRRSRSPILFRRSP